jgi:regulator of cell morphogenesis and NO signaling
MSAAITTSRSAEETRDWSTCSLRELVEHIQSVHHAYLRRELPRLRNLLVSTGLAVHEPPAWGDLRGVLGALAAELTQHMRKEEMILFPWIVDLERRKADRNFACGSVGHPIAVMEHEHRDAIEALDRMRWLTKDYATQAHLTPSQRELLEGLAALDADLREHIHEENDILFPRAMQLEQECMNSE